MMKRMGMTRSRALWVPFTCLSFALSACGGAGESGGSEGDGGAGGSGGTGGIVGTLIIGGAVATPTFAFVDGDTNDPNNPRQGNDFLSEDGSDIQPLGNPAVLGGYLGPIEGSPDVEDWYTLTLAAGQGATLYIPEPDNTDFDLYLFDSAGDLVTSSINTGELDWVRATEGGDHFLLVTACLDDLCSTGGPGIYNLSIGTVSISSVVEGQLSASHDFVEGDVLISEGDTVRAPKARSPGGWRRLSDQLDIRLDRGAPVVDRWKVRAQAAKALTSKAIVRSRWGGAIEWSPTIAAIKALRRAGTRSASPNYILRATAVPNDEFYSFQWHYPLIGLEQAWELSQGADVTVAVLDTGIVSAHPDFQGKIVAGYDFISDPEIARDGDGVDPNPEDPGDLGQNGSGSSFHGTHVAGTIAAASNNGQGVAGVAWGASIMPVRVLGVGGGTSFDICQAMLFAAGEPNSVNNGASPPADVINMSLGGGPIEQCMVDAIEAARAKGIFVVVAAGNDNQNADNISLAGIPDAFTVSAVDINKQKAFYSNFGQRVDVAAPGGDMQADINGDGYADGVLSTLADDAGDFFYGFQNGTSMAAPHFAGVVALMRSVNPDLTPNDVDLLLQGIHPGTQIAITEDLGAPGKDEQYGYGLVDALGAVRAASALQGITLEDPFLDISPRSVELTSTQPSATVVARNGGAGDLTITQVTSDQPWLEVNPTSGSAGNYQIMAKVASLADGIYLGTVSFVSNGGSASVSVRARVGAVSVPTGGGEIGTLYVLLVNDQYQTLAQAVTASSEGYRYTISDVAPGRYAIFAGTDYNDDGFIDDAGEALGGYPTLTDPLFVEITDSVTNVDFAAGFETRLFTGARAAGSASGAASPPVGALRRE